MNKTKIDWATMSWNPVTGCRHGCEYCYARRIAERFGGHTDVLHASEHPEEYEEKIHVLNEPLVNGDSKAAYPFGFEPTLLRYKLGDPARKKKPQTIFVCSMADLFGEWVPTEWIWDVMDACMEAPQHRYLFLTKNPKRYGELERRISLPWEKNFWYGATVTSEKDLDRIPPLLCRENTFWSMEPLLGPVDMNEAGSHRLPGWVILGAETGSRKDKVIPEWEWVRNIANFCYQRGIPVFYKDNLREYFPNHLPPSKFPWRETQ